LNSMMSPASSNATDDSRDDGFDLVRRELIVYACPTGDLAHQLACYFERTRSAYGPNAAHRYPAHITLTGFFHDDVRSIPAYTGWLQAALRRAARPGQIQIEGMMLELNFHGLLIQSPWLKQMMADFASAAHSLTRSDALRLKDWLHLSLAYDFPPQRHLPLKALARETLDLQAAVGWEMRFYERFGKDEWRCHSIWPLID